MKRRYDYLVIALVAFLGAFSMAYTAWGQEKAIDLDAPVLVKDGVSRVALVNIRIDLYLNPSVAFNYRAVDADGNWLTEYEDITVEVTGEEAAAFIVDLFGVDGEDKLIAKAQEKNKIGTGKVSKKVKEVPAQ